MKITMKEVKKVSAGALAGLGILLILRSVVNKIDTVVNNNIVLAIIGIGIVALALFVFKYK